MVHPRSALALWKLVTPSIRRGLHSQNRSNSLKVANSSEAEAESFFAYTSGRWIHEESRQLSLRFRRFDINALKEVAAHAGGGKGVSEMEKLAEGSYNKVFVITLDNGLELIARIPTLLVGSTRLVTASEVATMEYVRTLGVPVPRILAWCADASSTPVQSEYIIMEKASGIELGRVWDQISSKQKDDVVRELVDIEKRMMKPFFKAYGSVFHVGDVDSAVAHDCFAVGPNISIPFWEEEKREMGIDRGPWTDPMTSIKAVSLRERMWIQTYAASFTNPGPFDPHIQDRQSHLSLLDQYDTILPYIVPRDPTLVQPTLWHTDLHFGNIFLSQSDIAKGKITISAIIDWQHTCIKPLYLQARIPRFIRYHTPTVLLPGIENVSLPDDFDQLSASDQQTALLDIELANRHQLYQALSSSHNPEYNRALSYHLRDLVVYPVEFSGQTWSGKFIPLRETLVRIADAWDYLEHTGVPCPIAFSESERKVHVEEAQEWQEAEDMHALLRERVGVQENGWVSHEDYDESVKRNEELKEDFMQELPPGEERDNFLRDWPYHPAD